MFSYSLSCMHALSNGDTSNPLLTQVLEELTSLVPLGFHIVFCWIPGHIGIKGNEKVDRAAKAAALNLEVEDLSLPYSDFRPYICKTGRRWTSTRRVQYIHTNLQSVI